MVLLDILTFPLLHANFNHLLSNTLPLIIFGFLVFLSGLRVFITALAFSWLGSGLAVWLIGGGGVTVGASGLVFGFFAFLLVRGFFNRNWWQILLSVVLFMAYGSILFGVLPTVMGYVSWQAHLGGAVGGVVAAVLLRPKSTPGGLTPTSLAPKNAGPPREGVGRRRVFRAGEPLVRRRTAWRT